MDFVLRCNSLKCRSQLIEKAVVTTCSHIFCIPCSGELGLAAAASQQRICPACKATLIHADDVVATTLNPTEDYKTSVLSGLSPTIIIDCAGRALNFWGYQSTQEVVYQEYLAKSLTDKYATLNAQMDKLIHDANVEIDGLNNRVAQYQTEVEKLRSDNQTLLNALREKNRKHAQTQELLDRLKRQQMSTATQNAAFESVDDYLHAANNNSTSANGRQSFGGSRVPAPNSFNNNNDFSTRRSRNAPIHIRVDSAELQKDDGFGHSYPSNFGATPASNHRTQLGAQNNLNSYGHTNSLLHNGLGSFPSVTQTPQGRRPLGPITGSGSYILRSNHTNAGYGLSAGMRTGGMSNNGGDENRRPF